MLNGFKFVVDPVSTPNEMTLESTCILQYFVISKLLRVDFILEPNELVSLLPDSDLVVTSSTYFNSLIKIFNITGINEGKFICNEDSTDILSIDKMIKIFSAREGGELAKLLLQGRAYTPAPVFPYKERSERYGIQSYRTHQ